MQPLWLSFHADQADPWSLTCTGEGPNGVWWEVAAWPLLLLTLVMLPHHDKRPGQGSPKGEHVARVTLCDWDSHKKDQEKDFKNKSTFCSLSRKKIPPAHLEPGYEKNRISFLPFSGANSFPEVFTAPPEESYFPGPFTVVFPGPELGFDIPRRSASMSSMSWKATG